MSRKLPMPVLDALPLGAHRLICLTDESLHDACGVRIAFTGRDGGVSRGCYASLNTATHVEDDPGAVKRNREIVLEAVGADIAYTIVPNQVHGVNVVEVRSLEEVPEARARACEGADAVAVGTAGACALLNFADCLPLVIVSPTGNFAVAHAGWRGALAGVAGKAARALAMLDGGSGATSQCAGSELLRGYNAYIGPHIRSECFEVGADVVESFAAAFGEGVSPGPRLVDLSFAVKTDLVRVGLAPERIADAGICTKCNPERYYSFRASDGECGRHAAVAVRHCK